MICKAVFLLARGKHSLNFGEQMCPIILVVGVPEHRMFCSAYMCSFSNISL